MVQFCRMKVIEIYTRDITWFLMTPKLQIFFVLKLKIMTYECDGANIHYPDLKKKKCKIHYENLPMQYTVIFKVVKNENFQ